MLTLYAPFTFLLSIASKWLLIGRFKEGEYPLWGSFYFRWWLTRRIQLLAPINLLTGTPLILWYYRLMGARIGKKVFLDTWRISEFDLVEVNDYAAVNVNSTLQTHLFEDRVMKMSKLIIQPHCSIGHSSVVLYDTVLEEGSTLCNLSLLMKGEVLPKLTAWEGIPAQFKFDYRKLASLKKKLV